MQYGSRRALPDDAVERALRSSRDGGTRRAVLRFYRATPDLGAVTVAAANALRDANPPTLVVWGAGDPYVPVRFAQYGERSFRGPRWSCECGTTRSSRITRGQRGGDALSARTAERRLISLCGTNDLYRAMS
jgi:hypothetical protein